MQNVLKTQNVNISDREEIIANLFVDVSGVLVNFKGNNHYLSFSSHINVTTGFSFAWRNF